MQGTVIFPVELVVAVWAVKILFLKTPVFPQEKAQNLAKNCQYMGNIIKKPKVQEKVKKKS